MIEARERTQNKAEKDKSIYNNLIACPAFKEASLVLTYVSKSDEIDTLELIKYCFSSGKAVAVPRVSGKRLLFYRINSLSYLSPGYFGVMEPNENCELVSLDGSVCITPALACDKLNFRLGYGGGFYDRFLSEYKGISIGLCYKENIMDLPVEAFDVPLNLIIMEAIP